MGHLRLFFVLMGVLSAAYLLMCLVAPSELTLQWEGACTESTAVEVEYWAFPLGAMRVEPLGANRYFVEGIWGEHDLRVQRRSWPDSCVIQADWTSVRWPFLLRGAASIFNVRGEVLSHIEGRLPSGTSMDQNARRLD